jgi:hypothetical protein
LRARARRLLEQQLAADGADGEPNQLARAIRVDHRIATADAERARLAETERIRVALETIRHANPALGRHLAYGYGHQILLRL